MYMYNICLLYSTVYVFDVQYKVLVIGIQYVFQTIQFW